MYTYQQLVVRAEKSQIRRVHKRVQAQSSRSISATALKQREKYEEGRKLWVQNQAEEDDREGSLPKKTTKVYLVHF